MATLTEREIVDATACKTCGQPRGEWCRTKAGKVYTRLHWQRHQDAKSNWPRQGRVNRKAKKR